MNERMRAAVLSAPGRGLELREVPIPEPGPGEIRVRVAGCGFCRTDLHYLDHGVRTVKPPPIVLGHEIAGVVDAVGPGLPSPFEPRRVLLPAVLPCGRCAWCRSGRENICPEMRMFGNHIDGGFAEYVIAPARDAISLPESVDPVLGCVIADAISTPYHAIVHRARVRAGEWVAVVGCGGVGMNAVQLAALAGAQVIAVDTSEEKTALAQRLGAVGGVVVGTDAEAAVHAVRRASGGGVDVAVEAVGSPATFQTAIGSLRRGGRLCVIGYSDAPAPLPLHKVMFHEYSIVGSLGCRPVDYPRVVELVARGRIRLEPVVTGRVPLERIGEAADALRAGRGVRTVVTP